MPLQIPPFLKEKLHARIPSHLSLTGPMLNAMHDPFLVDNLDEFNHTILRARKKNYSVFIETDESPDALASAAIMRALLEKLGIHPAVGGQQSLFETEKSISILPLRIQRGAMSISSGGATATVRPGLQRPPYPFPQLSLSGLALKIVDGFFIMGYLIFPDTFVAIDFETTGKEPSLDEIIEIGAVRMEGGVEADTFSSLVRPRRPIPVEVERITHISNEMVNQARPIGDVLPKFLTFCGEMPLVAHNVPFDLAFLKQQAGQHMGIEIRNDTEDSLTLSRWLYPDAPSHRLGDMAALLGIQPKGWHRAKEDARTAAMIYMKLKNRDERELRELRLKHYLELAALGTIVSSLPLEDENAIIVGHGLRMMLRHFKLNNQVRSIPLEMNLSKDLIPAMLISLEDAVRREAALNLLADNKKRESEEAGDQN
jgi:DNA polymerase III epsilon subunit family exonuclease